MSNRLNQEREEKLQPTRYDYAVKKLTDMGYEVHKVTKTYLIFWHNGNGITLYPYSGWFTGKGIIHGRGIDKLIMQLKQQSNLI